MKPKLAVSSLRIKNFKAIKDSGILKFSPLTFFIGNNGSGKSSIIEALETVQQYTLNGLDETMHKWRGFEHVWYRGVDHKYVEGKGATMLQANPMEFAVLGHANEKKYIYASQITVGENDSLLFKKEILRFRDGVNITRNEKGKYVNSSKDKYFTLELGESVLTRNLRSWVSSWQFIALNPEVMTEPIPQHRTGSVVKLRKDGSNLSEYLRFLKKKDLSAFESLLGQIKKVISYVDDLQPEITPVIEKTVYLQLTENDYKVPSWMLSTGTLRLIALLAILNDPQPPPFIAIEEIENGLDPRSIQLLVSQLYAVAESGLTQVFVTTHSPFLLDSVKLEDVVLVERKEGVPIFYRPQSDKKLIEWNKDYNVGKLYTMGRLNRKWQE